MNLAIMLLLASIPEYALVDTQVSVENLFREASHPDIKNRISGQNLVFVLPPQWKEFPGFTATVRVRIKNRLESGKVFVSPSGTVFVEHLTDSSGRLVKQSLSGLVRLRLGKANVPNNGFVIQTRVIPNRMIQVRQSHRSGETLWTWSLSKDGPNGVTCCRNSQIQSWIRNKQGFVRSNVQSITWNCVAGFDLPGIIEIQNCSQPDANFRYEIIDLKISRK